LTLQELEIMTAIERLYRVAGRSFYSITPEEAIVKACTMPGRVVIKTDSGYFVASHLHTFDEEKSKSYNSREFLQMLWDNPASNAELELSTRANFGPCCDILIKVTVSYQQIRDIIKELSE